MSAPDDPSYRSSGVFTSRPRSFGASVNGSRTPRCASRASRRRSLSAPPTRSHSSPRPSRRRRVVAQPLPRRERHGGVDARAQRVRLVRALEDGEVAPRAHVVDRRHALRGDVASSPRRARGRSSPSDGGGTRASTSVHRVVLEHAGRLAARRRARSSPPATSLRRARHAGRLQRGAVRERHVAVEPVDPDRIVRRRPRRSSRARGSSPPHSS